MRRLALCLGLCPIAANAQTAPPPAPAETTAQGDVAVTIYNNNLALVQDRRTLSLPAGRSRQEFADVSASIRPETVTLGAPGTAIVEQNFDYDLLTPEKLMEKAVGQNVTLVRVDPATKAETREVARVLANNNGTIVQIGNRIEVLDRIGARVIFAALPPGLRARPTLSVTLDAERAGPRAATLNYLSTGLGWKADYVALFDEGVGKIDVQGWITLTNSSGTTYHNANTLLVAGAVGGEQPQRRIYQPRSTQIPGNRPGIETANREQLGDFYVYPIEGRTTIAQAQQKQVSFMDVSGAAAAKAYFYRNEWLSNQREAVSFATVLRFSSSRSGGLGDALPAGTVRVYMRDARGSPQFIGESAIGHTPMGSSLALKTGEAFDVKVQPILEKREKITSDQWESTVRYRVTLDTGQTATYTEERQPTYWRTTMQYKLTNARAAPVTVEVAQAGLDGWWHDTRIASESVRGEQLSADERLWKVSVPANGETVLTVAFDTRY